MLDGLRYRNSPMSSFRATRGMIEGYDCYSSPGEGAEPSLTRLNPAWKVAWKVSG